jgi:hypothetical protein
MKDINDDGKIDKIEKVNMMQIVNSWENMPIL